MLLEIGRRNAAALVEDLQRDRIAVAPALDRIVVSARRIFRGIVEEIEQHLLEQHGIELAASADRRRARARHLCCARILLARRSALPTISPRSCSAAFGTMAPDSSLVMSSRLAMKRLSRSDSSMMVASRSRFSRVGRASPARSRSVPAAPSTDGKRRLEIVRDRGQQRRAQAVGLDRALDAVHVLDQMHPLDRQRALIDQRVEQAALVRRQQRPGPVVVDADRRRSAPRPVRIGRNSRLAPGSVSEPRPAAGRCSRPSCAAARSASSSVSSGG